MSTKKVTLTLVMSTKGTHVYTDDSADATIPTLYIKKSWLPSTPPASITLTVEYEL